MTGEMSLEVVCYSYVRNTVEIPFTWETPAAALLDPAWATKA